MIALIDARSDSLTFTWPEVPGAKRYVLELKTTNGDDETAFKTLSSKLTQTQARKRNLSPDTDHFFRIAPVMDDNDNKGSWITHTGQPFRTLSPEDDKRAMEAPEVSIGGNKALAVRWKQQSAEAEYELQMRDNKGGQGWTTLASNLKGTEARKKNLLPETGGYQFRVRPTNAAADADAAAFSPPSSAVVAKGLSEALRQGWFPQLKTLLKKKPDGTSSVVPLEDALGGKEFILFYVSAQWCPPCRKYTPMLANWYNNPHNNHCCEIIFLSADHDEAAFTTYFNASHPWSAIDYESDESTRQSIMASLQIQGIPRLVVVNASTGAIIENNAVGKPLDVDSWRFPHKRKQQPMQ